MNLYLIRLENGNCRIVQAKDEADALVQGSCTEAALYGWKNEKGERVDFDSPEDRCELLRTGAGPQHCTVTKLTSFCIDLVLGDDGEFQLGDMWEDTAEQLDKAYPILNAINESDASDRYLSNIFDEEAKAEYETQREIAVKQERVRLLFPESKVRR